MQLQWQLSENFEKYVQKKVIFQLYRGKVLNIFKD